MSRSSHDKPIDQLREAARDRTLRRAVLASAAVGAGAAAAKAGLDLRSAAHAPEHDREFALREGEQLSPGLRRIARGQIDLAVELLVPADGALSEDAVHDARKALKRLRAVTRLVRGEIGPGRYRRENETLRDAARRLAGARDAEVLVDSLQNVIEGDLDGDVSTGVAALRAELLVDRQIAQERLLGGSGETRAAADEIRDVRGRAAHWVRPEAGFDAVAPGLKRIYRQGRRRARRAAKDPTGEHLHEWRKRVKDLRHVAEVLTPANPKRMRKLAKRADRLGETLGSEHDYAVLAGVVAQRRENFSDAREYERLSKAIERHRSELRRSALARGRKLYARKPKRLVKQIARDWRAHQDRAQT